MTDRPTVRIGIVGTGFVSRHFVFALDRIDGFAASRALTRRPLDRCGDFPDRDLLTDSPDDLLDNCDLVFECSGDPIHATDIIDRALRHEKPVVTLNAEFHVTAGSHFSGKGLVSEAEGDQPGSEAALAEEVREMGFEPLVHGNMKGFLNHHPTPEEMAFWGKKQNISLPMVTAFTDGTKLQIEQAVVANGLGATIARPGLLGPAEDDLDVAATMMAEQAKALGAPISDYLVSRTLPHGVFVVAEHDDRHRNSLAYLKLGEGPFYVLQKPAVLVHLEVIKTIKRVLERGTPLLDNSASPRISVATVAKRDLAPGTRIAHGIGCFDTRGIAVSIAENPGHIPIGLMSYAAITRPVEAEQQLTFDDVDIPDSLALRAWREIEAKVLTETGTATKQAV